MKEAVLQMRLQTVMPRLCLPLAGVIASACIYGVPASVSAQIAALPELLRPVPTAGMQVAPSLNARVKVTALEMSRLDAVAKTLLNEFRRNQELASKPASACTSSVAFDYALALHVNGRLEDCANFSHTCAEDKGAATRRVSFLLRAAACEANQFNYAETSRLYDLATSQSNIHSTAIDEAIFLSATNALFSGHEERLSSILKSNPHWDSHQQTMWAAVIKRSGASDLGRLTKTEVDNFLSDQIASLSSSGSSSGSFRSLLSSLKLRIAIVDYNYPLAFSQIEKEATNFKNPLLWYHLAYKLFYFGLGSKFALSRKIYDTYDRYAQSWWSLPVEDNTYNYSEIYGSICHNSLLQNADGPTYAEYQTIKTGLRSGSLNVGDALNRIERLGKRSSPRADLLTLEGSLRAVLGDHARARDAYWNAHRLCRYYNRANWGLDLENCFQRYSHLEDYAKNEDQLTRALPSGTVSPEMSTHILNWNSLHGEIRRRAAYGARIWLSYISILAGHGNRAYLKYAHELLSEAPGQEKMRDMRISGPGYPNDNRLWDDVRGLGGETVLADIGEVFQTIQGDYNLLGHEMAHQFQFLMEALYPFGVNCIIKGYQIAKKTNNFPDSYSSQNKEEHFAQGVTYYLVPVTAPQRFGLNQNWLRTHNRPQFDFIESINNAAGDLNRITCL